MVLPLAGFTTSEGVEAGLTRIVDAAGIPLTLHIKSEDYVEVETLARLVEQGTLLAVEVCDRPPESRSTIPTCAACCNVCRRPRSYRAWASGPALVHLREFGLAAWTTGSGCIAPRMVTALLHAAKTRRP